MTAIYNMHVCRCVIFHATAVVKGNNLEFQILCQNALITVKTRSLVVKETIWTSGYYARML